MIVCCEAAHSPEEPGERKSKHDGVCVSPVVAGSKPTVEENATHHRTNESTGRREPSPDAQDGHDAVILELLRIVGHHMNHVSNEEPHGNRDHCTINDVFDLKP